MDLYNEGMSVIIYNIEFLLEIKFWFKAICLFIYLFFYKDKVWLLHVLSSLKTSGSFLHFTYLELSDG